MLHMHNFILQFPKKYLVPSQPTDQTGQALRKSWNIENISGWINHLGM